MIEVGGTKGRILDAAEGLFAERGIGGTSLRSVISAAGVNLAAVHYHFGSKEGLLKAVAARRLDPINEERLRLLDRCEAEGDPALEDVVDAFLRPMMGVWFTGEHATTVKFLGRLLAEPEFYERVGPEQFRVVRERFYAAFRRAVPGIGGEELRWRMVFMIGAVLHMIRLAEHMGKWSGGEVGMPDAETARRQVKAFVLAGLRAPAAGEAE